jgi:rod shape-determining protein MreD
MTAVLPALSVLLAVVASAVPLGLPAKATFVLPLILVMMVFCWRALPGVVLPPFVAMLLGLLTDVMSGGPLGFWAFMNLAAANAGEYARASDEEPSFSALWLFWCGLVAVLACLGWLLGSLYFFRWIDWWPIAFGTLASIALFPVVLHGLLWIRRKSIEPSRTATYRGRT